MVYAASMECWNFGIVERWVKGTISFLFLQLSIIPQFHNSIVPIVTCPLVPQAASPCPSAIGFASGECRAGLAGGRACNGRRGEAN